jgi:hypothetical protein
MKILLQDFSAKVGKENIFMTTIGDESLNKISNYVVYALMHKRFKQ